jgi:aminoglycoside 3-N-acetyltransferase
MSEADAVQRATTPATIESLKKNFTALGIQPGMTLLVHSSLSALGWVSGGAVAVIYALEDVLGDEGTLVMPTHSSDLSDPARWENPPVSETWWQVIRDTMPAYDTDLTPTCKMGAISETFRKQRATLRSAHPQVSFAARGNQAERITNHHSLDHGLGEKSPLARIYDLNGWVLLLGVTHAKNTSLHLAEHRANYPRKRMMRQGAPLMVNGARHWVEFDEQDWNDSDFDTIGTAFARELGLPHAGKIASANALLMPQCTLVDFAVQWMERNRK